MEWLNYWSPPPSTSSVGSGELCSRSSRFGYCKCNVNTYTLYIERLFDHVFVEGTVVLQAMNLFTVRLIFRGSDAINVIHGNISLHGECSLMSL
jgi:hypothetical protein